MSLTSFTFINEWTSEWVRYDEWLNGKAHCIYMPNYYNGMYSKIITVEIVTIGSCFCLKHDEWDNFEGMSITFPPMFIL